MNTQNFKLKTKAFFKAHGSDFGCYGGMAATVLGTVLACRATLKVNKEAEEDNKKRDEIRAKYKMDIQILKDMDKKKKSKKNKEEVVDNGSAGMADSDIRELRKLHKEGSRELTHHYLRTGLRYCLHYLPSALLIAGGCLAIGKAHRAEKRGRLEMTGIATAAVAKLAQYRAKYRDEHGVEEEKEFFHGIDKVKKEETDEKGKKKVTEEKVARKDINYSDFTKFFGVDYSTAATGYPEADLVFLKQVERTATRKLAEDKWLTLNELYKMLCLRDAAGQRYGVAGGNNIGWVYDPNCPENNIVDLGLYNLKKTGNMDYINGMNDVIIVEPNVNCLDLANAMWGLDMKTPDPDLFRD